MGESTQPTGVLLVQLGTPAAPTTAAVRRYLREFLGDPRVLDINALGRWMLLNAIILPFRSPRSAAQYRTVWTDEGSPLLVFSRALARGVGDALGSGYRVELGMRYGDPSLASALDALVAADVSRIVVLPLFPQEAGSSSGSASQRVLELAGARWDVPELVSLGPFPEDEGFIEASAEVAAPQLRDFQADHLLLSYHGLPERQVRRSDPSRAHCLVGESCCDAIGPVNRHCYRAHCFATSRALIGALALDPERVSTSFQSRLGRTPWIRPFTDERLPELHAQGVRRLAVMCPSFVADCLETLEEIGVRAREQWAALGGEALELIPCVNAHPRFVRGLADRIRRSTPA